MTIVLPVHRALSAKLAGRGFNAVRLSYNPWLARVNSSTNDKDVKSVSSYDRLLASGAASTRSYATAAASKPVGRPKAHTGRTTAKRTTKATTTKTRAAAGKAKVGRKPRKAAKKKPVAKKTKKTARPKPKSKSALVQERRTKNKTTRELALLTEPKQLPASQWLVVFSEIAKSGPREFTGNNAKEAAAKYHNLSPEQKEHYNHLANQNKAANDLAYKKWTQQYTPDQILKANVARRQLSKDWLAQNPKRKQTNKFPPIHDDRLVKGMVSSYIFFNAERYASGDFAHMTVSESAKLLGREWKALSAAEKKKFEDKASADAARYYEEYKTVYGHEASTPKAAARKPRAKTPTAA